MIFEEASFLWDNIDGGEDVVHDDRLDDLSVSTQDIVYVGVPDNCDEVVVTIDTARRTATIYEQNMRNEINAFVASVNKYHNHGRHI